MISPQLRRYPGRKNDLLQAWDSADHLLLEHLAASEFQGKRIALLNDSFGALAIGLEGRDVTSYTDSYVSYRGTLLNSNSRIQPVTELKALVGPFDLAVIRMPKNMSFFEDSLCHLSQHLKPGAQVICGVMVKHLAKASFELLEKYIGKTHTSLAQKKARLVFSSFERGPSQSPYPLQVQIECFDIPFVNHSNLFSREKLDIGTRFLLGNLPDGQPKKLLDLGCGNGILGIAAKKRHRATKLVFTDDSQMAIQSAKANLANYFPGEEAEFHWTNCFEEGPESSVDAVLCNPPFHQGNTISDSVAYQMLRDAHRVLAPGGNLRIVGNTHLHYQSVLKQFFSGYDVVATNAKFTILDAAK